MWITFIAIVILYLALATTTILVLHAMSLRFRRAGGFTEHGGPYGPSPPPVAGEEAGQQEALR